MASVLSRRLQKTKNGQYTITIPKHLVQILGWKEHDAIAFGFEKGKITLITLKKEGEVQ